MRNRMQSGQVPGWFDVTTNSPGDFVAATWPQEFEIPKTVSRSSRDRSTEWEHGEQGVGYQSRLEVQEESI